LTHPLLLRRVRVVTDGLRLLSLRLTIVVLALRVTAVQRLLGLLLLQTLSITSEPGVMVLVSRLLLLLLLLAVITLVRGLLLSLLSNLVLFGVTSGGRLSRLCFGRSGLGHSLRLLQVLVLLVVLLGEHPLLLTGKLVLSETAQLVGLVEATLALAVDGLNGESGLLGLRHLRCDGLNLNRLLRGNRLLRRDGRLRSLNRRSRSRGGLSSFDLGRNLVFIQRFGGLAVR
jgi:hypothetical protein